MKKVLSILLVLIMCFSISACGGGDKNPLMESTNLLDAFSQFETMMGEAETAEEEEEIQAYMEEFFLQDLNGFFYYERPNKAMMHVDSDNRTIYVKSKEEVYIVPYSEQEMTDKQMKLEDIPQLENSDMYKYHVAEIEAGLDSIFDVYYTKGVFKSDYLEGDEITPFNSVEIISYAGNDPMRYQFYGYFADEQDLITEYDKQNNFGATRDYYRNTDVAFTEKIERDLNESDWGQPERKAEPEIGMSKDEVLESSWGSPDDKNIDEYEWGTEEQWVYDERGYIYFENGIVDAIQHR